MTDPTNANRAELATAALNTFGALTGQSGYDYADPEQLLEIAGDLVANLLHLAYIAGITPQALYAQADLHFDDELAEEARWNAALDHEGPR